MSDEQPGWRLVMPERAAFDKPGEGLRAYALALEELADEAEVELAALPVRNGSRQADLNREHGRRMPWHGTARRPLAPGPEAGETRIARHVAELEAYLAEIAAEIGTRPKRRKNMGPLPAALERTREVRQYAEWNRWRPAAAAPEVSLTDLVKGGKM